MARFSFSSFALVLTAACSSPSGAAREPTPEPDGSVQTGLDGAAGAQPDSGPGRDAGGDGGSPPAADASATDASATDAALPPIPRTACGFRGWNTRFTWKPTSVSMAVLKVPANAPEERFIGSPEVIERGDAWDMFYAMGNGAGGGRVGHAVSRDRGRTWERALPSLEARGIYTNGLLDTPAALYEGDGFGVYYFANTPANMAKNPDFPVPGGVIVKSALRGADWTAPAEEPALGVGAADAWDGLWVESPVVKRVGDRYFMWYTANDASYTVRHGTATSEDGVRWTRSPHNPAVSPSTDITRFDSFFPGGPAVAQAPDGTFLMLYACGARASALLPPIVANLCLATSPPGDGERFTPYPSADAPEPIIPSDYFRSLNEAGITIINAPINPSLVLDREEGVFKLYYENQASYIGLITLPVCEGM
jgi:hypothetical protein